jgi:hypothetical protein
VDFSQGNLLQFFYRYQRLVHTGSPFSRHRRSTASGHVVACASEGVEQSQPASRVQILSGHYNTAVRVPLPLQLRESDMFDLGSVPYKDSDELCIACVLSAHTLSVQKGSPKGTGPNWTYGARAWPLPKRLSRRSMDDGRWQINALMHHRVGVGEPSVGEVTE